WSVGTSWSTISAMRRLYNIADNPSKNYFSETMQKLHQIRQNLGSLLYLLSYNVFKNFNIERRVLSGERAVQPTPIEGWKKGNMRDADKLLDAYLSAKNI